MTHLTDDDVLLWLLSDGDLPPDRETHARQCQECSATLLQGEQLRGVLREPAAWDEPPSPFPGPPFLDQFKVLEDRLENERNDAEDALRTLSPAELERHIAVSAGTVGLARALIDRSYEEVEREPREGETYAALAILAATLLRPADYSRDLVYATRGQAWRQMANAHRMSGRLVDTLQDLDNAATAFQQITVPDPEIATLDYIRASVYYTQGRLTDARELLENATSTFRLFGDDDRYRNSRLLLAVVIERDGDRQEAIDLFNNLLREVPSTDVVFRGRVLHNLGVALLHDDQPQAESHLQQARHCLATAGLRTEALRALWNLGRAARRPGDEERAGKILNEAYEEAAALGLQIDLAMIALDRAEILLAHGDVSLVQSLCRDALDVFQKANAPRFAAEAFAYLEAAARQQRISVDDLTFVRDFFTAATAHPGTLFEPPRN